MSKTIHTYLLTLFIVLLGCGQLFTQQHQADSLKSLNPFLDTYHASVFLAVRQQDVCTVSTAKTTSEHSTATHTLITIEENEEEDLYGSIKKLVGSNHYFISIFFPERIQLTHTLTDILIPFYDHFTYTLTEEVYLVQSVFRL